MLPNSEANTDGIDPAILAAARSFVARLPARLGHVQAVLYGSRARGDHRDDSDIDLAITLKGPRGDRYSTGAVFSEVAYDIMDATGFVVHALPLWESDWLEPLSFGNPALLHFIEREGRRL